MRFSRAQTARPRPLLPPQRGKGSIRGRILARINLRLIAHLGFCTAFAIGAHPLGAVVKDGKTITVMLCSQPGVYQAVTIPLAADSGALPGKNPGNGSPDSAKPCHAMCCSRRNSAAQRPTT